MVTESQSQFLDLTLRGILKGLSAQVDTNTVNARMDELMKKWSVDGELDQQAMVTDFVATAFALTELIALVEIE